MDEILYCCPHCKIAVCGLHENEIGSVIPTKCPECNKYLALILLPRATDNIRTVALEAEYIDSDAFTLKKINQYFRYMVEKYLEKNNFLGLYFDVMEAGSDQVRSGEESIKMNKVTISYRCPHCGGYQEIDLELMSLALEVAVRSCCLDPCKKLIFLLLPRDRPVHNQFVALDNAEALTGMATRTAEHISERIGYHLRKHCLLTPPEIIHLFEVYKITLENSSMNPAFRQDIHSLIRLGLTESMDLVPPELCPSGELVVRTSSKNDLPEKKLVSGMIEFLIRSLKIPIQPYEEQDFLYSMKHLFDTRRLDNSRRGPEAL